MYSKNEIHLSFLYVMFVSRCAPKVQSTSVFMSDNNNIWMLEEILVVQVYGGLEGIQSQRAPDSSVDGLSLKNNNIWMLEEI